MAGPDAATRRRGDTGTRGKAVSASPCPRVPASRSELLIWAWFANANQAVEDSQRPSVLLAEDDPPIRILIETVLQKAGFEVTSVHDGAWAIAQIEAREFDVLLIDLMMGPTSGYSVLKYLDKSRPDLLKRVVVVTAAHGSILKSVQKFGIFRILKKPFDLHELHDCVAAAAVHGR